MSDRVYNIARMLNKARNLALNSKSENEKHYFEVECYKWESELMAQGINPDSIDSLEFKLSHGAFDNDPILKLQAASILNNNQY